jgi:hypothetical protein
MCGVEKDKISFCASINYSSIMYEILVGYQQKAFSIVTFVNKHSLSMKIGLGNVRTLLDSLF